MSDALDMPFSILSNMKINFANQKLNCSLFLITQTLPTTKQVELIESKKFIAVVLNPNNERSMIYVVVFNYNPDIYRSCKAWLASLLADDVFIAISFKYVNFVDILFSQFTA